MQVVSTGRTYGACPILGPSLIGYKRWTPMEPFVIKSSFLGVFAFIRA
ncbi:MAG: hypothetical protein ACK4LB_13075 [Spirosomataceae bacterium]